MLYSILYLLNENIDYTLAFKEKQIPTQCDFEPRLVRLILTEFHDFFFFTKIQIPNSKKFFYVVLWSCMLRFMYTQR